MINQITTTLHSTIFNHPESRKPHADHLSPFSFELSALSYQLSALSSMQPLNPDHKGKHSNRKQQTSFQL